MSLLIENYASLKQAVDTQGLLYVKGKKTKRTELSRFLGNGGDRKAFALGASSALIVPNTDNKSLNDIAIKWPKLVEREIAVSQYALSVGLLGQTLEKVEIFSKDLSKSIPAYKTDTFESLKSKNWFILDTKNADSSTWKYKFFTETEDPFTLESWDDIVKPLIKDISKIIYYDIPFSFDSLNIAVVLRTGVSPTNPSQYEARFFGFDYPLGKPCPQRVSQHGTLMALINKVVAYIEYYFEVVTHHFGRYGKIDEINLLFSQFFELLLFSELEKGTGKGDFKRLDDLKDELIKRHNTRDVLWQSLNISN